MAMRYWTSSSSSWRTCSARMLRILVRVTSTPQAVASAGRPLTARSRADRSLEPSSCSRSAIGSKSRSATVCAMVGGWTGGPHKGHHRRFRRRARAEDAPRGPPDDARGTRRTRGARRRLRAKSARPPRQCRLWRSLSVQPQKAEAKLDQLHADDMHGTVGLLRGAPHRRAAAGQASLRPSARASAMLPESEGIGALLRRAVAPTAIESSRASEGADGVA